MLFTLAAIVANSVNPIMILLILSELLRREGTAWARLRDSFPYFAVSLVSIGIAVILAESGKKYEVWPGHPGFPSGHMTFSTSAAACLVLRRGFRWVYITAPLAIAMGIALVYAQWHTPIEVVVGAVLGPSIASVVFHICRRYPNGQAFLASLANKGAEK